jgi:hypothetical protein
VKRNKKIRKCSITRCQKMIDNEKETEKKELILNRPTLNLTTKVHHEVLLALLLEKRDRNVVILRSYCRIHSTNKTYFKCPVGKQTMTL